MAAAAGSGARHGARKWLASLLGEGMMSKTGLSAAKNVSEKASNASGSIAKERLQIILAHQRGSQILAGVDLQALQSELLACVQVFSISPLFFPQKTSHKRLTLSSCTASYSSREWCEYQFGSET